MNSRGPFPPLSERGGIGGIWDIMQATKLAGLLLPIKRIGDLKVLSRQRSKEHPALMLQPDNF